MHRRGRVSLVCLPRAIVAQRGGHARRHLVIREDVEVVVLRRGGVRRHEPRTLDDDDCRRRNPGEEPAQEDVRRSAPQIFEPTLAIDGLVTVGVVYPIIPEHDAHVRHVHIQTQGE